MEPDKDVLLVEDNEDDLALTLRAFRRHPVPGRLRVARDGVEALAMLHGPAAGAPPALVLLDLKLPRLSGLDVLKAVRADPRTRLLPVVILTSSKEEQDLVASYSLGANSYIRKPVEMEKFNEAVRNLGLYWLVLNEAPPPSGA